MTGRRIAALLLFGVTGVTGQSVGVQPVVRQYCLACHNTQTKAGDLALDAILTSSVGRHPETWEKVVRKLRARYMPPVGFPRPDERTYNAVVSGLEASLDTAAAANPNPGRTDTFRRLTRVEYRNAVRDLLGIHVDAAALLPADESSFGFDKATLGELSPTLVERYLSAAAKISRLAVGSPVHSPGGETVVLPPDLTQEERIDGLPFGTRGGKLFPYTFRLDAEYEFQLRLTRDRNEHVEGLREPTAVELMLDGERVAMFTVPVPRAASDHQTIDKDLKIRIPVKAGLHMVGVAFPKTTSTLLETERQPYQAHFNNDRHPRIHPALYQVSIIGPYQAKGPGDTASRRRIFVCRPSQPAEEDGCAARILGNLMRLAYRRPITDGDLRAPLKFYRDGRAEGGFESGIERALRAILVSPEFLFRVERDPAGAAPNTANRISDLELASRLSFFLWSSIPDEELLAAAIRGTLHTPMELEKQVRRMLADARSRSLVDNFAEQWLYLRNLDSATPDMRLFPDFDDNLRLAFRQETELFFESIIREDRSILDLLRADYTFLNERLAKHYGIPNVYGSHFRRVNFGANGGTRGGLLRQGSILTVTSYNNRTSPVIRGKWIMSNLLGSPPPPPLPAVPALKEKSSTGKVLSMRERMAEHRDNPACSGCHQLMDPPGFSLENYDAVGRWRTAEGASPIDAAGGLPDGSRFEGVTGLQQALLRRPELLATTVTNKLLTYALGRGVEYYDGPAVRKVVRQAQANDFRFSSFILGIIGSTAFQMRRSP